MIYCSNSGKTGKVYRSWKESWPPGRNIRLVRGRREATRKAKASSEFNLARAGKDNRKGVFKYTADKTNTRGNVGPPVNEVGPG